MGALGLPSFHETDVLAMRGLLLGLAQASPPGPDVAQVREEMAVLDDISVPLRLYVPEDQPRALIIFFHGGGWTLGSVAESDAFVRTLAVRLRCAVFSVEYRLAPEHRFPAAVEDAVAAIRWAGEEGKGLLGTDLPLVLIGDSAGANLAAVASLILRGTGPGRLCAQVLLNPSTEGDLKREHFDAFEPPFLSKADIRWFFDQYVPNPQDRTDFRFAPLLASTFAGLPPTFVLTAEHDLLNAEGELFAKALAREGVLTTIKRYQGAVHSWLTLHPGLSLSQSALADIDCFLSGHIGG